MKTLIVTGGIGSGKSELCSHLSGNGIPVYDCDSRAKNIYDENPDIVREIEAAMGENLTGPDGKLDRPRLAGLIFADNGKLRAVEDILHPRVFEDFLKWRSGFEGQGVPYVVMESAIYLRSRYRSLVPGIVLLVDAPLETRISRACKRDGASSEKIAERMRSQTFDVSDADAAVTNDCDLDTFYNRAQAVIERLINK